MQTLLLLSPLLASLAQISEPFEQSLTGQLHPAVQIVGSEHSQYWRQDDQGMRVVLPGREGQPKRIGVATQLDIAGDFQVTFDYDLLSVEEPNAGFGAGVKIWGQIKEDEHTQLITFARLLQPDSGHQLVALVKDESPTSAEPLQTVSKSYEILKGQLRLVRIGETLKFLAAGSSDGGEFEEIFVANVSPNSISNLRFLAHTHGQTTGLDVRLKRIDIRPPSIPADEDQGPNTYWHWWGTIAALGASSVFAYWRISRRAGAATS